MSGIKPIDFIRFFVNEGHSFEVLIDDGELDGEVITVNKDNIDEFGEKMEKRQAENSKKINRN